MASAADSDPFQQAAPGLVDKDIFGLHLRQTSSGLWFDQRPLPSQELLTLCGRLRNAEIDVLLNGDGLPNSRLPSTLLTFHTLSHSGLQPPQLQGHHSLLLVSTPLPFDDSPPVFSLRSWVNLFRESLSRPSPTTRITVVLMARQTSAALPLLPILDRRFELDRLKAWKAGVWVLPDIHLGHRDPQTAEVSISPLPTSFPLLMFGFSSELRHLHAPIPEVAWVDTPPPMDIPSGAQAVHVLLNVPSSTLLPNGLERPTTSNRILGMLNMMDPEETSTQLRMASHLRYPSHWSPTIQKASPDKLTIAHYLVPQSIVDHLVEDSDALLAHNIRWMILSPDSPSYLVNHLPRKVGRGAPSYKAQSDEVLDSLLCNPQVSRLFEECVALNRWDVLVRIADGIDLAVLATTLSNLDHLLLLEARSLQVIKPSTDSNTVQPPHLILASPPTILNFYAVQLVCTVASILHHQAMSTPGRTLLTFEHAVVASYFAGARVPCGSAGYLTLTTGDAAKDGDLCRQCGLPDNASWDLRVSSLPALPHPTLSVANVEAVSQAMQEN